MKEKEGIGVGFGWGERVGMFTKIILVLVRPPLVGTVHNICTKVLFPNPTFSAQIQNKKKVVCLH